MLTKGVIHQGREMTKTTPFNLKKDNHLKKLICLNQKKQIIMRQGAFRK